MSVDWERFDWVTVHYSNSSQFVLNSFKNISTLRLHTYRYLVNVDVPRNPEPIYTGVFMGFDCIYLMRLRTVSSVFIPLQRRNLRVICHILESGSVKNRLVSYSFGLLRFGSKNWDLVGGTKPKSFLHQRFNNTSFRSEFSSHGRNDSNDFKQHIPGFSSPTVSFSGLLDESSRRFTTRVDV